MQFFMHFHIQRSEPNTNRDFKSIFPTGRLFYRYLVNSFFMYLFPSTGLWSQLINKVQLQKFMGHWADVVWIHFWTSWSGQQECSRTKTNYWWNPDTVYSHFIDYFYQIVNYFHYKIILLIFILHSSPGFINV